jgi:hypothetical protein
LSGLTARTSFTKLQAALTPLQYFALGGREQEIPPGRQVLLNRKSFEFVLGENHP